MTERDMKPGEDIQVRPNVLMEVGAAMNLHSRAKEIAHIDALRQEDTMQRLLKLAATREGLQALRTLNEEK